MTLTWPERCAAEMLRCAAISAEHYEKTSYLDTLKVCSVSEVERMFKKRPWMLFSEWSEAWLAGPPSG